MDSQGLLATARVVGLDGHEVVSGGRCANNIELPRSPGGSGWGAEDGASWSSRATVRRRAGSVVVTQEGICIVRIGSIWMDLWGIATTLQAACC